MDKRLADKFSALSPESQEKVIGAVTKTLALKALQIRRERGVDRPKTLTKP